MSVSLTRVEGNAVAYVGDAAHGSTLELVVIEFLNSGGQVGCGLVLDKASANCQMRKQC